MAKKQKKELTHNEWKRKFAHLLTGVGLCLLIGFTEYYRIALLLALIGGIILSVIERKKKIFFFSKCLDLFERPDNRNKFPGRALIMYVAAALLTDLFFQHIVVVSGLLILAIGDPIAHITGVKWGRINIPWNKNKQLIGRVVGTVVSSIVVMVFWHYTGNRIPLGIILAAAAGMASETLPMEKVGLDDNLIIPIVSCTVLYLTL